MYIKYAFFADAISETNSGKTAVNLLHGIGSNKFPFSYKLSALICIEGKDSEVGAHKCEVSFIESGNTTIPLPMSGIEMVNFEKTEGMPVVNATVVINVEMIFNKPGKYEILMTVDDRCLGSVPLYVIQR